MHLIVCVFMVYCLQNVNLGQTKIAHGKCTCV